MSTLSEMPDLDAETILNALGARKSFRRFLDRPLDSALVDRIISDSLEAPTACNHQMHHFVVISEPECKKQLQSISGSNDHFLLASHLVVLCFQKGWNHNKFAVVQSTAALAYHLSLSAHLRGVGTVWNAGIGNTDAIHKLLKIPSSFEIMGIICMGWPDDTLKNSKPPRRPLEVVRSYEQFERPSDHLYPLRKSSIYPYWKMKNHDNPFAQHDPGAWSLGQIREWRAHAVFAKSPTPGIYVSRRLGGEMQHEVASIGEIREGEHILEIMPFAGSYTVMLHMLAPSGAELHVVELSSRNLDFTAERLRNERGVDASVMMEVMNGLHLPYKDETFDAVLMPQVLEGLPDPWPLVEEALRVLRPGGRIGLSLRNANSWFSLFFARYTGKGQVTNFGPYRPIRAGNWRRKLSSMARIEEEWGVSPLPSRMGERVQGLWRRYSRLWVVRLRKLT